jgi:Kef-type K+ transport system membrane component KefB
VIAGVVSAVVSSKGSDARIGALAGMALVVVFTLVTGALTNSAGHWHEDQIVLLTGSIFGVCSASIGARIPKRLRRLTRRDHESNVARGLVAIFVAASLRNAW